MMWFHARVQDSLFMKAQNTAVYFVCIRFSRNHYAQQLLLSLRSGILSAPFKEKPPSKLAQVFSYVYM